MHPIVAATRSRFTGKIATIGAVERYNEEARRVVFFARCEASEFGSQWLEGHHLLLGMLREAWEVFEPFLKSRGTAASVSCTRLGIIDTLHKEEQFSPKWRTS